jgi:hypothetical protein
VWEVNNQTPSDRFSGASQQFPHEELKQVGTKVVDFNGRQIRARWDEELKTVSTRGGISGYACLFKMP